MNTTATWFRNSSASPWSGQVGYDGGALVGRFAFTAGAAGASAISWVSATLQPRESTSWSQSEKAGHFRWAVTADAAAYIGTVSTGAGYGVGSDWDGDPVMTSAGSKSVQLMPNTTYYLWVFPSDSAYNHWLITDISVTLSGAYGNPASPAAAGGTFGSPVGITLSGGSSGASYTVTASCAGRTELLETRGTDTYLSWTPAIADFAPLLPNTASAAASITVETFYGSASIGTRSVGITLSLRGEDVSPTVSDGWYRHAPFNEAKGGDIARYIAGISRARVTFDASRIATRYGASIVSYSVSGGGETAVTAPYQTAILTAETSVTVTVTDSRGFTASESFSVVPFGYAPPRLGQVSVFRCGQGGDAEEDGRYWAALATAVYSSVDGQNTAAIRLYLKTAAGSYGSAEQLPSGVKTILGPIDPDTIYDVKIEISDTVGNTGTVTRRLVGRSWTMRFRANGQGVAFGMSPQADRRLELPSGWEVRIGDERLGAYAVGDIFITTRSGDPAQLLGYGTWTQIKDRFLLAAGDAYAQGSSGGEAAHTLTVQEMPSHDHQLESTGDAQFAWSSTGLWGCYSVSGYSKPVSSTGGGQAHNNMPPYLAVYMWLRTA